MIFNAFAGVLPSFLAQLFVSTEPANCLCQGLCIPGRHDQAAILQGCVSEACLLPKELNGAICISGDNR